ncbi:MAG: glycosyltransferase family 4 protein [Bacteroidales bacterium]|nr:glycosyltransferase family 4 protein [Bacteroidales bacterium]
MRILLFSYISFDSSEYAGGNWIKSLLSSLSKDNSVGVVYLSHESSSKWFMDNVCFYPILRRESILVKFFGRYFIRREDVIARKQVDAIIENFKPDIIQLFGLETFWGSIVSHVKKIPVAVHIQGIAKACHDAWFPNRYTRSSILKYSSLKEILLRQTPFDNYCRFGKKVEAEAENYLLYRYFMGRTEWDKEWCKRLNPDSVYFHCDELIREDFYTRRWKYSSGKVLISSIANGEIYKGFDTILKTAHVLKLSNLDFEWNVYGVNEDFSARKIFEKTERILFSDCNVFFRGKKVASELADALEQSTFYIHCSHVDNSPNSLCEAMLVGVPCISSNVGGIPSLITDGKDGVLCPDNDVNAFAHAIMALHNDEAKMMSLSEAAHNTASLRHDSSSVISSLYKIYSSIIELADYK